MQTQRNYFEKSHCLLFFEQNIIVFVYRMTVFNCFLVTNIPSRILYLASCSIRGWGKGFLVFGRSQRAGGNGPAAFELSDRPNKRRFYLFDADKEYLFRLIVMG